MDCDDTAPMTALSDPVSSAPAPWTCPFCALHCDSLALQPQGTGWQLQGSDCPRALAALAQCPPQASVARPQVRGQAASLDDALRTAADWLRASRAPLIGGWATDVAGARSAYRLADRLGAVSDHAHGSALTASLRAQQDRGGYSTTLAEVHTRADLIVCVGTQPSDRYPEFFRRIGAAQALASGPRRIVFLGSQADAMLPADTLQTLPLSGDLFDTLAQLEALVAGRPLAHAPQGLDTLATQLRAARYAVFVLEPPALPRHGELIIEALGRLVGLLNQTSRAATLNLGGNDGAYTAQQVHTWLSGLPLRTRLGPQGLDHDPLRHSTERLLAQGEADALVWIASFGPQLPVPDTSMPRIVLGHPGMPIPAGEVVFIPVATPGIGASGHLARGDGIVVLPLHRVIDQGLPTVAQVIDQLLNQLGARA